MGALHDGHLSLIRRARQENDLVVVSIFVNPLQFGPQEDFQRYPRNLEADAQVCQQEDVDIIFAPNAAEMYGDRSSPTASPPSTLTQVMPPRSMISGLCGRTRTGHFEGVATVVVKLLNIVQPQRAYFGQKDAQQLAMLRHVVTDLNLPVEICPCPIVREADGLALSSRNRYLTPEQRAQATALHRGLQRAETLFQQGERQSDRLLAAVHSELAQEPNVQPEYVALVHPDTMQPLAQVEEQGLLAIAVHLGQTRLIDNIILRNRQPIIAIDGPAGAGKSTVVRRVAQELGLLYLDTGAMYRAVTWLVLQAGVSVEDQGAIAELVSQCDIHLSPDPKNARIWVNGQEVTQAIRNLEVTAHVSAVSAQPYVRQKLVQQQQDIGRRGGVVMDGRDIGTHVFPDAELKIYLTASVQERARRRLQDLKNQGQEAVSLEELEQTIQFRDWQDSHRRVAPLRKAPDAIEIQTDGMTIEEVTTKIIYFYRERLSLLTTPSN
jgi:pantoate ligase/cytidylate kinase